MYNMEIYIYKFTGDSETLRKRSLKIFYVDWPDYIVNFNSNCDFVHKYFINDSRIGHILTHDVSYRYLHFLSRSRVLWQKSPLCLFIFPLMVGPLPSCVCQETVVCPPCHDSPPFRSFYRVIFTSIRLLISYTSLLGPALPIYKVLLQEVFCGQLYLYTRNSPL